MNVKYVQESFANDSCMAINMVVLDDEHGFFFLYIGHKKARSGWVIRPIGFLWDIKKPYTTYKADCFQVYRDRSAKPTVRFSVLISFMSKKWMNIDSDNTVNGGSVGCKVSYATGSVMKVALTGFGYLYWNISTSETKQAPVKRLGLWDLKIPH